jgi:hypothetical protein
MSRRITHIVVHCTAASGDQPTQNILAYWRKKGWVSNGYHWLVELSGKAVRLQGDQIPSNGVLSHNSTSINICYKGGWNEKDTRTEEQKGMLEVILQQYKNRYPTAKIVGHRDLSPDKNKNGIIESFEWVKLCPCFDATKEYAHIKPEPGRPTPMLL